MLPGIIGCLQANEVVKLILNVGEPLIGRLLLFDALGTTLWAGLGFVLGSVFHGAVGGVLKALEALGTRAPT